MTTETTWMWRYGASCILPGRLLQQYQYLARLDCSRIFQVKSSEPVTRSDPRIQSISSVPFFPVKWPSASLALLLPPVRRWDTLVKLQFKLPNLEGVQKNFYSQHSGARRLCMAL